MEFHSTSLAESGNCFMPNLMCFLFICNGDVIHFGGDKTPMCNVMGDTPLSWQDARQFCRSRGGTISSELGHQAKLFRSNGVTGDLWSGYYIRNLSVMQDTVFTPIQASINVSHWDFTHPLVPSDDQCVSFTNADCSLKPPDPARVLPKPSCPDGYQLKTTSCKTKLDFMCQIPARRLESLEVTGSASFTIKKNLGKDLFLSSSSSNMSGADAICKGVNANARLYNLSTPADLEVLKFSAESVQGHSAQKWLEQRNYHTSLFWVRDANRHGCFAVSLQTLTLEFTKTPVISWPCHAKLPVLCAYDTPVPDSKPPKMKVVSNHGEVIHTDQQLIAPSTILLQALWTDTGSGSSKAKRRKRSGATAALRLGCQADLPSPFHRATIYHNNKPVATFSGKEGNTETDHFITPRQKIPEGMNLEKVMDLVGNYHCSINNLKTGEVLSSDPLFVRPSDIEVYPIHLELTGTTDDRFWSFLTLKSLLDARSGKDASLQSGSQVDATQLLIFRLNRFSPGYRLKPIAMIDKTFVIYAYKEVLSGMIGLDGEAPVQDGELALIAFSELHDTVGERATGMSAHAFQIAKVEIRSMDWCFPETRHDKETNQVFDLPEFERASSIWSSPQKCAIDSAPLASFECTGNIRLGFHWGPTKMNPNCKGKGSSAVVQDPDPWCEATTQVDAKTQKVYRLPDTPAGETWSSREMCAKDNTSLVTVECKKTTENSTWGPARINPLCDNSEAKSQKSPLSERLEDLSKVAITTANTPVIITETKTLLSETSPDAVTQTDVTRIADVLQRVTSSRQELPESTAQELLDTAQLVSELPQDVLVGSQSRGDSTNKILKATDSIGAALQLKEDETHKRIVSGGFGVEVWDLQHQSPDTPTVVGFKTLAGGNAANVESNEIVTEFADGNETSHSDTEAAIYLPEQLLQSYTNRAGNQSVRLALNIYKDVRLHQFSTSGATQKVNQVKRILNSKVIAAQILVDGQEITDLRGYNVVTVLKPTQPNALLQEKRSSQSTVCAFWDFSANDGLGDWNTTGCAYSNELEGRYVCQCDHLTNFAVLVSYYDQSELEHKRALGIISIVGLSLSIIGLLLSMISFLFIKKLQKSRAQQTMFHLSLALLLSWIVFLAGVDRTSDHGACVAVAAMLHYLILASFMWMLMEGVLQYLMFVKVMNPYFSNFLWKTVLPSWGLPIIPVIVTLSVDPDLYRGGEHYCWMSSQVLYYGFAIPVGLIVLTNLVIFVLICVSLWRRKDMRKHSTQQRSQNMVNIRASFICFIMLGLTWLFGFLAIGNARLVFQYLFCITSSLQGFVVFLMITARDQHIRQFWLENACCCMRGWLRLDSLSSAPSSSSGSAAASGSAKDRFLSCIRGKKSRDRRKKVSTTLSTTASIGSATRKISCTTSISSTAETRKISRDAPTTSTGFTSETLL